MAKILVVEDDGIVRDALRHFLQEVGHRVVTAADGQSGLQTFQAEKPDLVVLDREIPVMTGSQVLARIRETSKVPVIVLTGFDSQEGARKYHLLGVSAFLSKGDGIAPLLDEVKRITDAMPDNAKRK